MRLPKLFKNKYYLGVLFLIGAFFVYFIFRQVGYRVENMQTRQDMETQLNDLNKKIKTQEEEVARADLARCSDEKKCPDLFTYHRNMRDKLGQLNYDKKKLEDQINSTPSTTPTPTPTPTPTLGTPDLVDRVSRLETAMRKIADASTSIS